MTTGKIRLALFQPDIPQNTGAILRLGACFGLGVDVIEPCGFVWHEERMRRSGMDYLDRAVLQRHRSWSAFQESRQGRLILLTTRGAVRYTDFAFAPSDILLFGRESAGVPEDVHHAADARLTIPMVAGARSLNVAQSAAIVASEALRQLGHPDGA